MPEGYYTVSLFSVTGLLPWTSWEIGHVVVVTY